MKLSNCPAKYPINNLDLQKILDLISKLLFFNSKLPKKGDKLPKVKKHFPEGLVELLLIHRRVTGGVNVTEAAREVAPWTGVPGGALSRQGEAEAVLNLLNLRSEVLEHDVEAILMSHHKK